MEAWKGKGDIQGDWCWLSKEGDLRMRLNAHLVSLGETELIGRVQVQKMQLTLPKETTLHRDYDHDVLSEKLSSVNEDALIWGPHCEAQIHLKVVAQARVVHPIRLTDRSRELSPDRSTRGIRRDCSRELSPDRSTKIKSGPNCVLSPASGS